MNNQTMGQIVQSDAKEIEALAADWFGRRQFWTWSEEDQAQLDVWLAESLAHQVAYWRLVAAWDRTERLNAVGVPMRTQSTSGRPWRGLPKTTLILAGAAGSAVIAGVVGVEKAPLFRPSGEVYSTAYKWGNENHNPGRRIVD